MSEQLAEPLRLASGGHIVRSTPVAIAPGQSTFCPSAPPSALSPTLRRTGSSGASADLLLNVEIIVYSDVSGSFTLGSTPELLNAGVVKIHIIATKNTRDNRLAVSLNASGFLSDGSLVLLPSSDPAGLLLLDSAASSWSPTATVISAVVAGLVAVSCAVFVYLRWQQRHRQCMSAHAEMAVQYTSMALEPGGCSCVPQADSMSSTTAVLELARPFYATVGMHFPGHVYAT
jgi:hypothetical protein